MKNIKDNNNKNQEKSEFKNCSQKCTKKKFIIFLVVLNFLFMGHLMTFSIINKNKIDSLIELNNTKDQRYCDSSSKEIMKKIIEQEKRTGKIISKNKEKDLIKLKLRCLYNQGYSVDIDNNEKKNIQEKNNNKIEKNNLKK